jgi:hypothetical protein
MGASAFKVYHLQRVVVFGRAFTGIVARGTQDLKEDLVTVESVLKVLCLTKPVEASTGPRDTVQTVTVAVPNAGGFRDVQVVPRRTVQGLLEYSERLNDIAPGEVVVSTEAVVRA